MAAMMASVVRLCKGQVLAVASLVLAATSARENPNAAQIAQGKYLVAFGDCNACHMPLKMTPTGPEPVWSRMRSGHPEAMQLPVPPKLDDSPWFAATAGMTAWAGVR